MKALSDRNDAPHLASRPFDIGRDGFVLSEGAGILIFEELEHAKARGACIYAEVLGYGASGDAGHITQPDPQGSGAARAMQNALRDAKLPVDKIDYINAHGTSTPLGDKAETQAMKAVYGQARLTPMAISSTKGHLGHALGASGGIEMILTALAVHNNIVPPTINLVDPDPACDLNYTPNVPIERDITTAMNNSFGFGGPQRQHHLRQSPIRSEPQGASPRLCVHLTALQPQGASRGSRSAYVAAVFLLANGYPPSSRKALAAVCAANSAGHTAHRISRQAFARWPSSIAAQTAASALRREVPFAMASYGSIGSNQNWPAADDE